MSRQWVRAGEAGCDTGQFIITDPAYLLSNWPLPPFQSMDQLTTEMEAQETATLRSGGSPLEYFDLPNAVVVRTHADGGYPVYVELDPITHRPIAAMIRFDGREP